MQKLGGPVLLVVSALVLVWLARAIRESNYQLGDAVTGRLGQRHGCWASTLKYSLLWPTSFASRALRSSAGCADATATLCHLIRAQRAGAGPSVAVAAHIRLADVTADRRGATAGRSPADTVVWSSDSHDDVDWPGTGMAAAPIWSGVPSAAGAHAAKRLYPRVYYDTFVFPALPRNSTIVVYSSHSHCDGVAYKPACARGLARQKAASRWYIARFSEAARAAGHRVSVRWNGSPDDVLIALSTAKVFVQGGGGFSELAAACARQNNNTVLWRNISFQELIDMKPK